MLDTVGSLWMTTNSGGDSVSTVIPNASVRLSSDRIIKDSSNIVVHLPIYCTLTRVTGDLDMKLHYRTTSLHFVRTRLFDGTSFDVPSTGTEGTRRLHVPLAALEHFTGTVLGTVDLLWTPVEADCEPVVIDSIRIGDPCTDVLSPVVVGYVGTQTLCGLSETDVQEANSDIDIYDERGERVLVAGGELASGQSLIVMAGSLPTGVYSVRISGDRIDERFKLVFHSRP
jgi:hypothetical protein